MGLDILALKPATNWVLRRAESGNLAVLTPRRAATARHSCVCRDALHSWASDILIIPVLVDGATTPSSGDLPKSLRTFADRNAAEVDGRRDFTLTWAASCRRLIESPGGTCSITEQTRCAANRLEAPRPTMPHEGSTSWRRGCGRRICCAISRSPIGNMTVLWSDVGAFNAPWRIEFTPSRIRDLNGRERIAWHIFARPRLSP